MKTDKEKLEICDFALANMEEGESLREDNCEAAMHMDYYLEVVKEKIGRLIKILGMRRR